MNIRFLATTDHRYTLYDAKKRHLDVVKVHTYDWLARQNTLPGATWVFTDHERLSAHELDMAASIATQLVHAGNTVFNHPARVKLRYELLSLLRRAGVNGFGVWRASSQPAPDRFPVLLKAENDHKNRYKDLIHSQAELDQVLNTLLDEGIRLENVLVISFANSPIREGVYAKHSVFRVGDDFLSFPKVIENNWAVKYGMLGLSTDAELDQSIIEMHSNPFAEPLRQVFNLAGINYGRVDFGFENGQLAVYEINTNPSLPSGRTKHRRPDLAVAINSCSLKILDAIAANASAGYATKIDWTGFAFKPASYVPWRRLRRP